MRPGLRQSIKMSNQGPLDLEVTEQGGKRFFVPDLAPYNRTSLSDLIPRVVFVGESPHVNEVEPEALNERRPLCGAAGRQWWKLLGELLEGEISEDVSLVR